VRQRDPWTAAQATAAKAPVKFCITCSEPFTPLYRDSGGRPRLRDLKRWSASRALYGIVTFAQYRHFLGNFSPAA
jgi:hypothetical protein